MDIHQLAKEQRLINVSLEENNSVLELLNQMIGNFFAAITFRDATAAEVDAAIVQVRVKAADPWVQVTLAAIRETERVACGQLLQEAEVGMKRDSSGPQKEGEDDSENMSIPVDRRIERRSTSVWCLGI